ncbi:MAG: four helix bundle protein [Candidatus Gracilibacteria bacterium]|nr:four helix bundle protein [Candidatus Gracilibacteria bacterium]
MKIEKFEELTFWKESIDTSVDIFKIFEGSKDLSFKNQITEMSVSVGSNIAHGFERRFETDEFKNYLYNAIGSNTVLRSMLYIGKDLGYISEDEFQKLYDRSVGISKMIGGFIKTFKKD